MEEWIDALEKLPEIDQRVRVLVVKEMTYLGQCNDGAPLWKYDQQGEHGIYSWCPRLKDEVARPN